MANSFYVFDVYLAKKRLINRFHQRVRALDFRVNHRRLKKIITSTSKTQRFMLYTAQCLGDLFSSGFVLLPKNINVR